MIYRGDRRMIIKHEDDDLEILVPFSRPVSVGDSVEIVAGCAHTLEVCEDKFANAINYANPDFATGASVLRDPLVSFLPEID